MPYFGSQDPSSFGWQHGAAASIVPFSYRGWSFPAGVAAGTSKLWTEALDRLTAQPGFELHPNKNPGVAGNWGYSDRKKTSGNGWSFHAYGLAIDIAAPWNPYGVARPPAGPYRLPLNTSQLVRDLGMIWGAEFNDWMHLELHLSPAEVAALVAGSNVVEDPEPPAGSPPAEQPAPAIGGGVGLPPWLSSGMGGSVRRLFPLPAGWYYGPRSGPRESVSGYYLAPNDPQRIGLQLCQAKLGTDPDGLYGPVTGAAARRFQSTRGLVSDALIGARTWAALFPS